MEVQGNVFGYTIMFSKVAREVRSALSVRNPVESSVAFTSANSTHSGGTAPKRACVPSCIPRKQFKCNLSVLVLVRVCMYTVSAPRMGAAQGGTAIVHYTCTVRDVVYMAASESSEKGSGAATAKW